MCHFGVDLLLWPIPYSRENTEIILYVQNPVDLLIQLVTFFARLKISTCVCKFRVDLLIWSVTFSREKIEIILHVQNTVDPLIQPVTFLPY